MQRGYQASRICRHRTRSISRDFGNLTAGVYAWQWGLPVGRFLAATNMNDVVPQYLQTGIFAPRPSLETLSNAMDVGNPSNFERLRQIFDDDFEKMGAMIRGEAISDPDTLATIARVHSETGIILDPHTAVGWCATRRYSEQTSYPGQAAILATAHPAKFNETIREAIGTEPDLPDGLARAMAGRKRSVPIRASLDDLRRAIE